MLMASQLHGFNAVSADGGNDSYTKLLLHCDGADASTTFTDSSASAHTVTAVGNAQIDTAQSKFGGASGLFDGAGDRLSVPTNAVFDVGSGIWTIDFWVRPNATTGGFKALFHRSNGTSGYSPFTIFQNDTEYLFYGAAADGSWGFLSGASLGTATAGTWTHLAAVRVSATIVRLFNNGTQVGSDHAVSGTVWDNSGAIVIGNDPVGGLDYPGHLDEIRFSNGIARWTANFTPPVEAYF